MAQYITFAKPGGAVQYVNTEYICYIDVSEKLIVIFLPFSVSRYQNTEYEVSRMGVSYTKRIEIFKSKNPEGYESVLAQVKDIVEPVKVNVVKPKTNSFIGP